MSRELRVGTKVLYGGEPADVVAMPDHNSVIIKISDDKSVLQVAANDIIVLADVKPAPVSTPLMRIDEDAWEKAVSQEQILRAAANSIEKSKAVRIAAQKLKCSERHAWRLMERYRVDGRVTGFIPRRSGRKAGGRCLDPAVETIIHTQINTFYLKQERPTVTELHRRIAAQCRTEALPVPHDRTVASRVQTYRDKTSVSRREGTKAAKYKLDAMPGHAEAGRPLDRIEIDHTPIDVIVRSDEPMCSYVGRPWLTIAIDVHTRAVLGILIAFDPPSSLSVALCLTHAMVEKQPREEFGVPLDWPMYGKPKEIVVDNAREFDAAALRRGCQENGIILTFRPIGSPHYGGTIERLIGTMMGKCHLLPGTTKRSVASRGNYDAVKHATMTLRELRTWFVEQILGSYHITPHRTLRVSPLVAWQRATGGTND